MSIFGRLRHAKTSSSQQRKSQYSRDDVKNASGEKTGGSDTGASLFSGMTLTASPATKTAAGELSLIGDAYLVAIKQDNVEAASRTAVTQDVSAVLDTPGSEVLPEPIQPMSVNTSQHAGHSATKKKKTRHTVRPGYARQSDTKTAHVSEQNQDETVEMSINEFVEKGRELKQDVENSEKISHPGESPSVLSAPMYSIGTPSSSDENLFQEDEAHSDSGNLIPVSSDVSLCGPEFQIETYADKEAEVLANDFKEENIEVGSDHETFTQSVSNNFGDSMLQVAGESDRSLEDDKLSTLFETCVASDESSNLPSEDVHSKSEIATLQAELAFEEEIIQNEEHDELQKVTRDLVSTIDMESPELGITENMSFQDTPNDSSINMKNTDKLSIALHHIESLLLTLSDDKQSLRILEEELLKLYTETEGTITKKEQKIKELQEEESQALANDNYDLAEDISSRLEQLKINLEFSRYRIPAQDDKVERALKLKAEIAEKEADIYRQSQAELEEVRDEQQECLFSHKEMSTAWSARERQRLNTDRMRLERARDHLRLDKEHMETENMELNREILQQTEAFQWKKEELMLERGSLQAEILALEAKLKRLKEKEAEFTDAIKQQEDKIDSVKMEFAPHQSALEKQQQEIEEREKTLQKECEMLLSTQKQFDEKTAEHSTKEEKLTKVLSAASDELEKSTQIIKALEKQQQSVKIFSSMDHFTFTKDSELERLHAKKKEVSQQIKALSNKIHLGQRGVVTLRKSLNEIESQVSDLDAAKEIAKQERNFKEAKRLKEEREALTIQGVESQERLESLLEEITKDKKALGKAEQESEDLNTEISEKDRQDAFGIVEKASLVIHTLQKQINSFDRIGCDSLVKVLLETEARTCKNLISDLCNKQDIPMPNFDHVLNDKKKPQDISEYNETTEPPESSDYEKTSENETKRSEELERKLSELEERLEAVVEVEDFDEADRLQHEIIKLKEMMEERPG